MLQRIRAVKQLAALKQRAARLTCSAHARQTEGETHMLVGVTGGLEALSAMVDMCAYSSCPHVKPCVVHNRNVGCS